MKVKFNRIRLINALKQSKIDALTMYKKETKSYHEKLDKARDRHISNVEKYLQEVKNGGRNNIYSYGLSDRLNRGVDWPPKLRKPRFDNVDALINQLSLSDDEVIVCDTKEEYVQLTRACAVLGTCKA